MSESIRAASTLNDAHRALEHYRAQARSTVRGGLQDELGAPPSDFFELARGRALDRLSEPELAGVLRGAVDEYFATIVQRTVDRAVRRARVDGKSDLEAVAHVEEHLDEVLGDVFLKGKMARQSPLALSRVVLDLFAMHTADRFEAGHPLDVVLDVHRDLHAGNFEFVVDPGAGTYRISVRKHDYETGGLGPRRSDLDKSGMNLWLSALQASLSREHERALTKSVKQALRAEYGKKEGTALFDAWEAGELPEVADDEVVNHVEELAAEIEQGKRVQIARLAVSEMALAYRDTIHELMATRERDPEATPQKLVTADAIPEGKLRDLAEEFQLRDADRLKRRYVDEERSRFAENELTATELRPLGDTHRRMWARELAEKIPGFADSGRELVDIAERRGAGGASLGASDKLLLLVKAPEAFEIWYAKEPMGTPFHYATPLNELAAAAPGVPMKLWQAQMNDAQRTLSARQRQLGARAPDEVIAKVGGIRYLVSERDPTRKSFDVELLDSVSLIHFAKIKGVEMANGHAQSWFALPELHGQLPRGTGRFGDLRDGLDEPPFVEDRVRHAEQDAAAMEHYADVLSPVLRKKRWKGEGDNPELEGFKKRMKSTARARLTDIEESFRGPASFKPHQRR